jgi:FkbM family methyltransferase
MVLDLASWSERLTYFLGRYYDLPSQLVLRTLLRPGDEVIDVGANVGMITLLASHIVGPSGRVEAFEPNPECVQRLRQMLSENRILNVGVHGLALSDREGTALLTIVSGSSKGTLSPVPMGDSRVRREHYEVTLRRGDDVQRSDPARLVLVKIDTEGHEVRVVRGLQDTLAAARPAVLSETMEEQLKRAGFRMRELARVFEWLGYAGYAPRFTRAGRDYALRLEPLGGALPHTNDTLWLHPESEAHTRLARLIG